MSPKQWEEAFMERAKRAYKGMEDRYDAGLLCLPRMHRGDTFSPLDRKLKLREDHWSEGAARVATRQGLQAKSFELAAEAYSDEVGAACQKADTAFSHVVYP